MSEEYKVISLDNLIAYLESKGREIITCDYQLDSNLGLVYELDNNEVAFLPGSMKHDGLLFKDKNSFQRVLGKDEFPLENPDKEIYEAEKARILRINKNIDYYRQYLNERLKTDFQELTKEALLFYLKKLVGRTIRKTTENKDVIALIAVIGELVRQECNGKWFVQKRYGVYNPYYVPNIVSEDKKAIFISDIIIGNLKWKVATLESIFNNQTFARSHVGVDFEVYSKHATCTIIE